MVNQKKNFYVSLLITHAALAASLETPPCAPARHITNCSTLTLEKVDNLATMKNAIKNYRASGAWRKSNECLVKKAKKVLSTYIPVGDKKLAVIFDIDDTLLSTWDINIINDFGYIRDVNHAWEMEGKAPAIEPMLDLFNFLKTGGFTLFAITGREEYQRAATIKNLYKVGFRGWKELFFKPAEYVGLPACVYKSKFRGQIAAQGYTIIASFGDQFSDASGTNQAIHNFKLSNPMYLVP